MLFAIVHLVVSCYPQRTYGCQIGIVMSQQSIQLPVSLSSLFEASGFAPSTATSSVIHSDNSNNLSEIGCVAPGLEMTTEYHVALDLVVATTVMKHQRPKGSLLLLRYSLLPIANQGQRPTITERLS